MKLLDGDPMEAILRPFQCSGCYVPQISLVIIEIFVGQPELTFAGSLYQVWFVTLFMDLVKRSRAD